MLQNINHYINRYLTHNYLKNYIQFLNINMLLKYNIFPILILFLHLLHIYRTNHHNSNNSNYKTMHYLLQNSLLLQNNYFLYIHHMFLSIKHLYNFHYIHILLFNIILNYYILLNFINH